MENQETKVEQVEIENIEDLLNGSDNIILPSNTDKKVNVFTRKSEDLSYLNNLSKDNQQQSDEPELGEDGKPKVVDTTTKDPITTTPEKDDINTIINNVEETDEEKAKKPGRPKTDKEALVELTKNLIEKKILMPFDDDKKIEEYTLAEFEELYQANNEEKEKRVREELPVEFFNSLPQELQYAAKYVSDGGTDLRTLFRTLAGVEEVKTLDPKNPEHQKQIVRSYLQATDFGTPEDIEEEITNWDDHNELEAKALKFKPKLDALTEKQVQYQVTQQAKLQKQREEASQLYMDNIYKTLEPGELNGIKIDKKIQNSLFSGLVQPNYKSVSGRPTNLLGHLLEKYQYVEPNHALVAEALWLLSDPEGYKSKVKEGGKKEAVTEVIKKLKQEESRKLQSHVQEEVEDGKDKKNVIPKNKNMFKRFQ